MAIPKIIHQTWKTKDIPHSIYKKRWIDSWLKYNPNWKYNLWTDEENRLFIKQKYPWFLKIYDSYPASIQKADAIRYFLLFHYGGLYVDLDFECLKNIEPIMRDGQLIFAQLNNKKNISDLIPNAFMASSRGNKFWLEIFKELIKNRRAERVEESTGSAMLTKSVKLYCLKEKGHKVRIIASKLIYPIDWTENSIYQKKIMPEAIDFPQKKFPDAFAITYWTHNWESFKKDRKESRFANFSRKILTRLFSEQKEKIVEKIFENIYKKNGWRYGSGSGSLPQNTANYREFLQSFIKKNNIKTVLDAGCGDWQFSKLIDWNGINYVGYDIVKFIIDENNKKYSKKNIKFEHKNIITDELPETDLLLIKDVLQHLSFRNIFKILKKIKKFKYVIIMNGFCDKNQDCEDGSYRPLNFLIKPFNLNGKEVFSCCNEKGGEVKKTILLSNLKKI